MIVNIEMRIIKILIIHVLNKTRKYSTISYFMTKKFDQCLKQFFQFRERLFQKSDIFFGDIIPRMRKICIFNVF